MSRPPVRALKSCTRRWTLSSVRLPGTTLTTKRCSGSKATWSPLSPWWASSGFSGSQCFSFLPTKAHFSSNGTSFVRGGKSHAFVVDLVGVLAGDHGEANHRILVYPDEAAGLSDPTILLKVLEDGDRLILGKFAAIQRGAFAFGESLLTGPTGQDTSLFLRSVTETNPEVVQAPPTIVMAGGVLAAEGFQVVQRSWPLPRGTKKLPRSWIYPIKQLGERQAS